MPDNNDLIDPIDELQPLNYFATNNGGALSTKQQHKKHQQQLQKQMAHVYDHHNGNGDDDDEEGCNHHSLRIPLTQAHLQPGRSPDKAWALYVLIEIVVVVLVVALVMSNLHSDHNHSEEEGQQNNVLFGMFHGSNNNSTGSSCTLVQMEKNGEPSYYSCRMPLELSLIPDSDTSNSQGKVESVIQCQFDAATVNMDMELNLEEHCQCQAALNGNEENSRSCGCGVCPQDSRHAVSLDCSNDTTNPYVVDDCVSLGCDGECNGTVRF